MCSRVLSFHLMPLLERFRDHIGGLHLPPGRALLAVSGGPDSVALLDLMVRSRDVHGLDLIVAHLDHGIHPASADVAVQVEELAASYEVPFEGGSIRLGPAASETLARARRYAWLEATRARVGAGLICTAHHLDDQIETVLMRVIAGSGPAGLSGIAPIQGRIVRPLLPFRRAELTEYLREAGRDSWLDPANTDPRHLRSWIRTELLPSLHARVPRVSSNLERLAVHAARDRHAWDAVLDALPDLDLRGDEGCISVAATTLADYDSALKQAIILAVARRIGCRLGPTRAGRVLRLVEHGVSGARVPLGNRWTAELAFGRLRLYADSLEPELRPWSLQGQTGTGSWGRWHFRWEHARAPERQERSSLRAWFTLDPLTVRAWSPGERLKPIGGTGRRLVVRCFQEVRVPRSRRGSWPVLAQDQDVMWIPGVCRSDAQLPVQGAEALRVDAEYA
jgi:tRNA(Ile)-lysidine synthase